MIRLAIILSALCSTVAFAQSDSAKVAMIDQLRKNCRVLQRAAPENAPLSTETIGKFCDCLGSHAFEILSYEELERSAVLPVPDVIQKKLNMLAAACYSVAR